MNTEYMVLKVRQLALDHDSEKIQQVVYKKYSKTVLKI